MAIIVAKCVPHCPPLSLHSLIQLRFEKDEPVLALQSLRLELEVHWGYHVQVLSRRPPEYPGSLKASKTMSLDLPSYFMSNNYVDPTFYLFNHYSTVYINNQSIYAHSALSIELYFIHFPRS